MNQLSCVIVKPDNAMLQKLFFCGPGFINLNVRTPLQKPKFLLGAFCTRAASVLPSKGFRYSKDAVCKVCYMMKSVNKILAYILLIWLDVCKGLGLSASTMPRQGLRG